MPNGKNIIASTLAIMALVGFLAAFFALGWVKVPTENEKYLMISLTALINCVSIAFGYFLGSSFGSTQKNQLMSQVVGSGPSVELPPALLNKEAGFINFPLLLGLGLLCIALAGCATTNPATTRANDTPVQLAGKSLLAAKATIGTAAQATDGLCRVGTLKPDICAQAKTAYEKAKPAYDMAVDSYLLVVQGGDPAEFTTYMQRLKDITNNLVLLTGGAPSPYPTPVRPLNPAGKDQ